MIKHIVMWRLRESAHGKDKATNARLIKQKLEALRGRIPGLINLEVGINLADSDNSSDVVLYSEFTSRQALQAYLEHAEHKAIMPFVLEARSERRVVDYEDNAG